MGAANVIPGVSGGTIALITGVFERLINAIKSFNIQAMKLLVAGRFTALAAHVDLAFLVALFAGIAAAIISLAKVLEFLFAFYPIYVWSFFLGLVLTSIFFVGQTIGRWSPGVIISFLVGTAVAAAISVPHPGIAKQRLLLPGSVRGCGHVQHDPARPVGAVLSLVLMGNYQLVMIHAREPYGSYSSAARRPWGRYRADRFFPFALLGLENLLRSNHCHAHRVYHRFPGYPLALENGRSPANSVTKSKTIGYEWHLPAMDTTFFYRPAFYHPGHGLHRCHRTTGRQKDSLILKSRPAVPPMAGRGMRSHAGYIITPS